MAGNAPGIHRPEGGPKAGPNQALRRFRIAAFTDNPRREAGFPAEPHTGLPGGFVCAEGDKILILCVAEARALHGGQGRAGRDGQEKFLF